MQPIDAGTVNLCFVIGVTLFQTLGGSFAAALAYLRQLIPALDERLRGATPCWTAPASVAGCPTAICVGRVTVPMVSTGSATSSPIPSFTGEGIAIALRTARLAADAIMAGVPSRDFAATARREVRWPMRVAALLETMIQRQAVARPAFSSLAAPAFCHSWPERPGCRQDGVAIVV